MKKIAQTPRRSPPLSTVSMLVNGTERIGYAATEATWAAYTLEMAGEVYDLVPHLVAQAMGWRPREEGRAQ